MKINTYDFHQVLHITIECFHARPGFSERLWRGVRAC
jgi:hypothetical protein